MNQINSIADVFKHMRNCIDREEEEGYGAFDKCQMCKETDCTGCEPLPGLTEEELDKIVNP